jgi:hypothetical protein
LAQWGTRTRLGYALLCALAAILLVVPGVAQTTSSISGTVKDTSDALVPGARVTLINEASKASRSATSNAEGYFYFTAVQPAVYSIQISLEGFESWKVTGIEVHPGDSLTVPKIHMKIGAVMESVVVTAEVAGVTLTSGEHSTLITAGDLQRLSTTGRDAAELVSMLPGFTANAGTGLQNQGADYTTMGFGSGNLSSYGANGAAPQQGLVSVSADGANVIDPGDMGGQLANVNMDQVQEVKVQTSNFGADEAKGPVVINAVGKSGGDAYHGGLYTYFRNAAFNSNDWLSKNYGTARAESKYFYPGGTLGGPVKIPGLKFNQNKHMTFWVGFEYYGQQNVYGLATALVPSIGVKSAYSSGSYNMLGGDFSANALADLLNISTTDLTSNCSADYSVNSVLSNVAGNCAVPSGIDLNGNTITNGQIGSINGGSNSIDPATKVFTAGFPAPNRVPRPVNVNGTTQYLTDGINYSHNVMASHDGYQLHGRVDQNFSDNLKLYGTYNLEKVNDQQPMNNIYYNPAGTLAFPTPLDTKAYSDYLTLNLTKILNATTTNELTASGVFFNEPEQFENRAAAQDTGTSWATAGYSGGWYKNGVTQLPRTYSYESFGMPSYSMGYVPGGSRGQYLRKFSWNVADNFSRQIRTHSLKAGIYAEQTGNNSITLGSEMNGQLTFARWDTCNPNQTTPGSAAPTTTVGMGNTEANFLIGCAQSYAQQDSDPGTNMRFKSIEGYLTDEWKVNAKLTVTLGMRFSHYGPWEDAYGIGSAIWDPSALTRNVLFNDTNSDGSTSPKLWQGIKWHANNPEVPVSGVPTRALFYAPRFGVAYDLYGNGKTTFRGGWGAYHGHDSAANSSGAEQTANGLVAYGIPGSDGCSFAQLFHNTNQSSASSAVVPCGYYAGNASVLTAFSISALDPKDDRAPVTYNYNFTLDQQIFWKSSFEISYSGNQSSSLSTLGNLQNQNVIPLNAFFGPDPAVNSSNFGKTSPASNIPTSADYRPYPNYSTVLVPTHSIWANYNALQASWNKQRGNLVFGLNYTWSKAMGVRGNYDTGYVADPVNPHHDYGILGFDRPQVFNASYSYQEGNRFHVNRVLAQVVNGWELSGITSLQSGPDLAVVNGTTSYNFSGGANYTPAGGTVQGVTMSAATWLGSSDYILQPTVTCDPRRGLKKNQFVNGNCFGVPQQGTQGAWNLPDSHGPAYFKFDLSLYKDVKVNERQNMQFRLSGFNFLNHPITSFNNQNLNSLNLTAGDASGSSYTTMGQALAGIVISNASSFGSTSYKVGVRIVELGFKYNF